MKRWATIILGLLFLMVILVPKTHAADEKMTGRMVFKT